MAPICGELENENHRLKKVYFEERLKAENIQEAMVKSGEAISATRDGAAGGSRVGEYQAGVSGFHAQHHLLSLSATAVHRECRSPNSAHAQSAQLGGGLCFLYLHNVKGYRWNHKRVYRIYRELDLNLRIKPRKRIVREKVEPLGRAEGN